MKLREYLDNGTIDRNYFRSKTQFYNAGTDFLIYRVATLEDFGDDVKLLERFFERGPYFFVVPARYDITLRVFIELVPTEVFRNQHLDDILFEGNFDDLQDSKEIIPRET